MKEVFRREQFDPYIIAEIGMNHEGSMSRAKSMIESVARAGAHAAKFQTYKAATLASRKNSPSYWDTSKEPTRSQFELFSKYDSFGFGEYVELATHCESVGIDFLTTPFDLDAVGEMAPIMPSIKIASADLTNVPLLRKVAATRKPVILSTGASSLDEISWALGVLEDAGATEIALLFCVLNYPTEPTKANLQTISTFKVVFGDRATIGYSDHVAPTPDGNTPALELATFLGAQVIEKHFTDDRMAVGNDHYHAVDEAGLSSFIAKLKFYRELLGHAIPDLKSQQAAIDNARRRIFANKELIAGQVINEDDLVPLRANEGIEVHNWDSIIGSRVRVGLVQGQAIEPELLD